MPRESLIEQALALLSSSIPYAASIGRCDCALCTAARATRFRCRNCGYHGAPLVYPCFCAQDLPREIEGYAALLAESEAEGREPQAAYCRRQLAELLTTTPQLCGVEGREVGCSHGDPQCPVCAMVYDDNPRWTERANRAHPWAIIRALRKLLEEAQKARRKA